MGRQPLTPIGRISNGTTGLIAQANGYRVADLRTVRGARCANCCCLCTGYDVVISGVTMCTACQNFPSALGPPPITTNSFKISTGDINGKYFLKNDPTLGIADNVCNGGGTGFITLDLGCKVNYNFYPDLDCGGTALPQGLVGGSYYYTVSLTQIFFRLILAPDVTSQSYDPAFYVFQVNQWIMQGVTDPCGLPIAPFQIAAIRYFTHASTPPPWLCGRQNVCGGGITLASSQTTCGYDGFGNYIMGTGGSVTITPKWS